MLGTRDTCYVAILNPVSTEPPSPLTDPSLYLWYRGDAGVTVNGSNELAAANSWLDQSGNSHHFGNGVTTKIDYVSAGVNGKGYLSFTTAKQSSGGFVIGGTLAQPYTCYLLLNQRTWSGFPAAHYIQAERDPLSSDVKSLLTQNGSSPQVVMYAGNNGVATPAGTPALTSWHIVTMQYNGASSRICSDKGSDVTGDAGTSGARGGIWWGFNTSTLAAWADFYVAGIIVSSAANNSTIRAIHVNWLSWYANLGL